MPPVSVVTLGFKRSDIKHALDGFGMLVPEVENRKILGCLFSSTLFEDRTPYDHVMLTCFVGGTRQPKLTEMANQRLVDLVYLELDELLGISGPYVYARVDRWKQAIPQYNLGYQKIKDLIQAVELENKDFYFAGNYLEGISVGDCMLHAFNMAKRIDEES
jgi:oxygen-dependent protoporphyrinogen oxidase